MRIIAGKFKGKVLKEFELSSTRPTADMVKGAIFNILGSRVQDSAFLDLFSGTGAVGIEALSRGAKQVAFVDSNKESVALIRSNLKLIKAENFIIMQTDSFDALKRFSVQNQKFNIIFLDPPYASVLAEKCIKLINKLNLLEKDGIIVWEHDETKLSMLKENEDVKTKKYGKKYVSIIPYEILENYKNVN